MIKVCEQISNNVNILAFENIIKVYNFFGYFSESWSDSKSRESVWDRYFF